MEICEAIDIICEKINIRDKRYNGIDIGLPNVGHIEEDICKLFSIDGNVMTSEARFGEVTIFCWGETKVKHEDWVNQH